MDEDWRPKMSRLETQVLTLAHAHDMIESERDRLKALLREAASHLEASDKHDCYCYEPELARKPCDLCLLKQLRERIEAALNPEGNDA